MDSSAATVSNGVLLPIYPLASGFLPRAIEHSGSVLPTSTDDAGEYYPMAMAKVVQAEEVPANSILVRKDVGLGYTMLAHTSIAGKSKEKLTEKASGMPPPMKQDLIRSIQARK